MPLTFRADPRPGKTKSTLPSFPRICRWQWTVCRCAAGPAARRYISKYTPDKLGDAAQGAQEYSSVTGIETTHEEMLAKMDVIFNIERCIQVREGRRRENDFYPDSLYKLDSWKWTTKAEFEKAMDEYYVARGWDPATGIPRRSTLEKLGLKQIADDLEIKNGINLIP
jgi:aldehyde:ferredoxin oxidoreductase